MYKSKNFTKSWSLLLKTFFDCFSFFSVVILFSAFYFYVFKVSANAYRHPHMKLLVLYFKINFPAKYNNCSIHFNICFPWEMSMCFYGIMFLTVYTYYYTTRRAVFIWRISIFIKNAEFLCPTPFGDGRNTIYYKTRNCTNTQQ